MRARSLLAAALLLAACGTGGEQQTTQPTASTGPATTAAASNGPTTTATASAGPTTGAAVPDILDFTAETVRGEQVAGADYAGQDLVLWFWAPW